MSLRRAQSEVSFRLMRAPLAVAGVAALVFAAQVAVAAPSPWLIPPVDGVIVRRFDPPRSQWGAGHRGIDYGVPAGTAVRAAAAGVVSFAGRAADVLAVTIRHEGGLSSTYSMLSDVYVSEGEKVGEGRWIGTAASSHAGESGGLHFGVKLEGDYVDPEAYLGPLDVSGAIHLAPLPDAVSRASSERAAGGSPFPAGATVGQRCRPLGSVAGALPPPNDNVAVVIAGLGSQTRDQAAAREQKEAARALGYPHARIYLFSYNGVRGPRFHRSYRRTDTYGDLRVAARRLRKLLVRIARRHPGRGVDLLGQSQGGIVARVFLEHLASSWEPTLPRVEHLVTFATPHTGAPLAALPEGLERETFTGRLLTRRVSEWARKGGPIADPRSEAVRQLAPGSALLDALASEDVLYGTRVLALGVAHDALVPADRAVYPGKPSRIVGPEEPNGHGQTYSSRRARSLAHAFLRDAGVACPGFWDEWGPRLGRGIGWAEGKIPSAYGQAEEEVGGRAFKLLRKGFKLVAGGLRHAARRVRSRLGRPRS